MSIQKRAVTTDLSLTDVAASSFYMIKCRIATLVGLEIRVNSGLKTSKL